MAWPPRSKPPPPPPPVPGSPEAVALLLQRDKERREAEMLQVVPLTRRERRQLFWYRMRRRLARWASGRKNVEAA